MYAYQLVAAIYEDVYMVRGHTIDTNQLIYLLHFLLLFFH